jgi:hypothetical protein
MSLIEVDDLLPFSPSIDGGKAQAMIDDAMAMATLAAPCITEDDFAYPDQAKAIIRGAILRWDQTGAAGRTQVSDTVGPFIHAESYQQPVRRSLFSAPEIQQLQALCKSSQAGRAFEVDSTPPGAGVVNYFPEYTMWSGWYGGDPLGYGYV